jgi:LysM repeat protein
MESDDDGGGITGLLSGGTPTRKSISRTSLDRGQSSDRDFSDRERERRPIYDGHRGYGSTSSLDNFLSPKKINLAPTGKPFNATVLIDPASCKVEHQVQRNDTLEGIAIKYGVTVRSLESASRIFLFLRFRRRTFSRENSLSSRAQLP